MIDAMKQAEKLLVSYQDFTGDFRIANLCGETITALRQAIAQAERQQALDKKADNARELGLDYEPVPVGITCKVWTHGCALFDGIDLPNETLLYTAPPQAEKQEPVAFETWLSRQHGDPEEIGFLQALKISYEAGQDSAPPRKEWVGLDVEDCRRIRRETERDDREDVIQMTETILREKNT